MAYSHLSLETLAKWLAGRLEQEEVLQVVVPHHLETCVACRGQYEEIKRLQEEVGHWDEEVAVVESQQAPELWDRLVGHPFEEQIKLIEEEEALHLWGFCQLLLKRSLEAISDQPSKALELADLAVRTSRHLGDAYDPHWVSDLRARAFAYLGNARRVLDEFRSAEAAFRKAEACLARSTTGNSKIEAEIFDLKSSLRRDQRRLSEALILNGHALSLYRDYGDKHGVAIALIKRADLLFETGETDQALEILRGSAFEIRLAEEPRLFLCARYNLLCYLTVGGHIPEAEELLPEVKSLFRDTAQPLDFVRLRWAEGNIALGLGRIDEAEDAFREVQSEFLERGMAYNAALVSLDLAILLAQEHRNRELKVLALELLPVFESREIHREALATLLMFQRVVEEDRLTETLAREIAGFLRQVKTDRNAG